MTSKPITFEEYCAERTGRDPVPAMDPDAVQEMALHLLGYYGKAGGYMPGAFTAALIRCWELADNINQAKLASVWPELAHGIYLMRVGDIEGLQALAERRAP